MKGLTHFISGIAAATFVPDVVRRSASGHSFIENADSSFLLALAGLYAIMPDTLDFKVGRFFEKAEINVSSEPENLNAQEIANTLGKAMDDAWTEDREIRIQFNTVRVSADRWRRYEIMFDTANQEVSIVIDSIVTTSQTPFPGTEIENPKGVYKLKHAKLLPGSTRDTNVDILSGPMYGFKKESEYLAVEFLPWHRTWSHSYTLGMALAALLLIPAYFFGWDKPWLYPLTAFLGFATHITEDLTGHMGGSLIWPFIKRRTRGLCLFHAANPDANFVTDFIAVILIVFNLDRFGHNLITIPTPLFFLFFLIGPLILYFLPRTFIKRDTISKPILKKSTSEVKLARSRRLAAEEMEEEAESL